jgi:biopolymer transport protein ExbD
MTARTVAFNAEPNVTPMIDVMLVMLIVFMVAVIRVHRTIDTQLPQSCRVSCGASTQIVLEVLPGHRYRINQKEVPSTDLLAQLRGIYAERSEKIIEVAGDRAAKYKDVIAAMDIAKSAGVTFISVPPKASR